MWHIPTTWRVDLKPVVLNNPGQAVWRLASSQVSSGTANHRIGEESCRSSPMLLAAAESGAECLP